MPTVPSSFIPQVGMAGEGSFVPYQAPPVMPMDEATSKQQEELGRAMIAAGNTAYRLGSAMQDDIDDAATKEADTAAIGVMTKIRSDFMSKSGKDAESNYQSSVDQMSSAVNGIMDGLGNDTQKRMFQQVAARNMATFQSQMYDHRNAQTKQWASNEAAARADKYSDLAIISYGDRNKTDVAGRPMGLVNYQANLEIAVQEVRKAASLNGIPEGSEQMKMMEQKVYDKVATGVVNDLMNARQYGQAEAFLDDHPVDPKVDTSLRSSLDANRQRSVVGELAASIKDTGLLMSKSDPDTYWQQKDGPVEPPTTLREAMVLTDQIADDQTRKFVQAELRTQFAQDDALIEQEYRTLIDNTEQFLAVPGNSLADMPADQFGRLRPVDRAKYMAGQRQQDEMTVMEQVARNPALVTDGDWLERNRSKMTHSTFVKLLGERGKPDRILSATIDADQLEATLLRNGFNKIANPPRGDDAAAAQSLYMRDNVKTLINAEQERIGRQLSRDEKQRIIDRTVLDKVFVSRWGSDPEVPFASMTPGELAQAYVTVDKQDIMLRDIPPARMTQIRTALERSGLPTDIRNIAETWLRAGKPQ